MMNYYDTVSPSVTIPMLLYSSEISATLNFHTLNIEVYVQLSAKSEVIITLNWVIITSDWKYC